jgi:hypothetical protein
MTIAPTPLVSIVAMTTTNSWPRSTASLRSSIHHPRAARAAGDRYAGRNLISLRRGRGVTHAVAAEAAKLKETLAPCRSIFVRQSAAWAAGIIGPGFPVLAFAPADGGR